jgi:serine/threonine-protein kinase
MIPKVAVDQRNREAFVREIQNTKSLRHRNVVCLHDDGFSNGTFYFTLEFCDGGSLDALLQKQGGKLSVTEAVPLVFQALDGLEYAHSVEVPDPRGSGTARGLVHRDLKPHNLFLSGAAGSPVVKVADFGLAKAFDTAGFSGQTRTGSIAGTPVFMPRQQVINFKYARPDVDLWAMAATLYHLLTGRFPRDFPFGRDPWQTVLQTDPVPIRKRDSSIPKKLAEVVDTALHDRKRLHFKTAAELHRALADAV